jgi:hypothetical protein
MCDCSKDRGSLRSVISHEGIKRLHDRSGAQNVICLTSLSSLTPPLGIIYLDL